eukprot:TRINITY_DN3641_c0_g2_i1.p1 TRINITY_DN3641_c0_g2~~TRINITY_DN3641_c0_g2_i1.p1  ORF type:complete len:105 (-),score=24.26 TRINITY_DN3641_c0_g2_i1:23-337(-)
MIRNTEKFFTSENNYYRNNGVYFVHLGDIFLTVVVQVDTLEVGQSAYEPPVPSLPSDTVYDNETNDKVFIPDGLLATGTNFTHSPSGGWEDDEHVNNLNNVEYS